MIILSFQDLARMGVTYSGWHGHVVAGVGVDDGALFAVEAQRALGDEEGLVVHFVPLVKD
jgi:hypothetical protein